MLQYNASKSQFWFEVGGQPAETFQLVEFYGAEAISQPFRFELRLIAPIDDDLNLPDFLNQPAKLTILREDEQREQHGMLSDLEETGRTKDFAFYRGVFVPRLWRLSLFYQSRVFQNQSVPDIIEEVFKTAGFGADDYRLDLSGSYKPREYCVQYRETDLNFINRLMEYEGIYYIFDHADGKDVVVMVDDNSKNPIIDPPEEIKSFVGEGFAPEQEETVNELVWHEKVVTGKVKLKDYNYRTPETNLSAESQIDGNSPGLYYEYGEHFKTTSEGETLAKTRNEEIECARRIISGASNCRGFHAGYKFALAQHYREALNEEYLLTQVSHAGNQGGGIGLVANAAGGGPSYRNEFTCIPASVQYRQARLTPEPRIPGIMTAKVESAGGDYAYIDEEGKYRVKMPFDLGDKSNGGASRAIRMAQPYSGANYGIHFPNRANTEMVWACIDGNVDRPLGLSTVPNPSNKAPSIAANKAQCVIRTAGQNELTLDDTIGSENIFLHGTKDWTIDIVNDKSQKVGNNESLSVGSNRDKTVGANQSEKIGANKSISVGGNHNETITGNMTQMVSSAKAETIALAKALSIGAGYQVTVGAAMNETIGAVKAEQIGATKTVTIGANSSEEVGTNKSVNAGGNISESAGNDISCQAGKGVLIQAGGKMTLVAGDDFSVKGEKEGVIEIKDQLVIKCGKASITFKKNGDISIEGSKINIKGSGDVKIKGSKIEEN